MSQKKNARQKLAPILASLLICATAGLTSAQAPAPVSGAGVTYIWAGHLYTDMREPVQNRKTIIIADGRISSVVDGFLPAPNGGRVIDLSGKTVLPGLIDSHVHLLSELSPTARLDLVTKSESDWTLDGLVNARKTLDAGFTTVADLGAGEGGHAIFALRDQFASGRLLGPRIIAAGSTISPTGGHADVHGYRDDIMHVLGHESICDGADDCRRAVRGQIREGADIIKVTATGGVLSNTAAGLGQQFTSPELVAIAETAHSMGRQVTAHAHGKAGIDSALEAGFDSIEHGTYLDAQSITLFREHHSYLVPTLLAGATVLEMANNPNSGLTEAQRNKAREAGPLMMDMARRAHAAGVMVAFGTDSGVSRHGENAREFGLLVQAGFTPREAITAATITAAAHFKLEREIGQINPGFVADIIAVDSDPIADVAVLRHVSFVMARGRVAVSGQ